MASLFVITRRLCGLVGAWLSFATLPQVLESNALQTIVRKVTTMGAVQENYAHPGIAPAQQTHEDQGQQDPTQTVEAVAQATEHTLRDLQQPLSAAQATTARRALRRPLGRRGPPPAPAADSWAGGPCAA